MATIEQRKKQLVVVADNDDERALIQYAQQRGKWLVLLESNYPVGDERREVIGLPQGASMALAVRVCAAFKKAALAHAVAEAKRRRFRLVD